MSNVKKAIPLDPINTIVSIFDSYHLVGLSEGINHGDECSHAFLRKLIANPKFTEKVNDIVVEWGSALYQGILDQYTQGVNISEDILSEICANSAVPTAVWDKPIYRIFFQKVREINQNLPKDKKLRVLLGDPPLDWNKIKNRDEFSHFFSDKYSNRDSFPANLIQREVIDKNRCALIVYGAGHLLRNNILAYDIELPQHHQPLVRQLEDQGIKIFTIWVACDLEKFQEDISSWPIPSLTMIKDTPLGKANYRDYLPYDIGKRVKDGKVITITNEGVPEFPMEKQFDAIMYAGPSAEITISKVTKEICTDAYIQMRIDRMQLYGFPQQAIDEFKDYMKQVKLGKA